MRFLIVGALNTLFGYTVYFTVWRLTESVASAVLLSSVCGVIFNFFTTGRIVFRKKGTRFLLPFLTVYGMIFFLNWAAVEVLIRLGVAAELAQLILLPFIAALAYVLLKFLVFGRETHGEA